MSDGLQRRLWDLHRECREEANDDRIGTIYQEAADRITALEAQVAELERDREFQSERIAVLQRTQITPELRKKIQSFTYRSDMDFFAASGLLTEVLAATEQQ